MYIAIMCIYNYRSYLDSGLAMPTCLGIHPALIGPHDHESTYADCMHTLMVNLGYMYSLVIIS